jgi:3-oxoacyl-[acyl-carrier-protein] synthase-3
MALLSVKHVSVKGISACVPSQTVYTRDYTQLSEAERNLFIKTSGISERRVAPTHTTTSDLCYHSAEKLISDLKWNKEEIDCLIFVSQSPDYFLPATSILLQKRLGLKNTLLAFDINLGCSGYVYGLSVISSLLAQGQLKKGLLLAGDKSTLSTHHEDKSTYPLFGDAGSATALEFDKNADEMFFNLQSDGTGEEAIKIMHGGARYSVQPDTFDIVEIGPGIKRSKRHLQLDGIEILNFALREVGPNLNELFTFSGIKHDDVDYFVFHQANLMINESVRKKLKITDVSKVPYSIQKFGNTSSASIPLTIVSELKNLITQKNSTLALSGFGVGFSWASCILKTNHLTCCDLLELD